MAFSKPTIKNRNAFDAAAIHPLQSWAWGEFREKTGVRVERLWNGVRGYQVTFHALPKLPFTIGYAPRCEMPTANDLAALKRLGEAHRALFIKLEPNVSYQTKDPKSEIQLDTARKLLLSHGCKQGRPLFTNYSFHLDLSRSEADLLAGMKSKTRYNVRLAEKKGVLVRVDDSAAGFEEYIKLWKETTTRQGFYAHTEQYQRNMWETMRAAKIAHLLTATYAGKVLVTWVVFVFNGVLYYPYGGSSRDHQELMASNLLMWEAIRFGKNMNCHTFDMWGSLGPEADASEPWYGFHRFKAGYGGALMEFVGSYDLVINPLAYPVYRAAEAVRWPLLRLKTRLFR